MYGERIGINRIRLEFKGGAKLFTSKSMSVRINRIRLEFKAHNRDAWRTRQQVLIESDWNLKYYGKCLGNGL